MTEKTVANPPMNRREFMKLTAAAVGRLLISGMPRKNLPVRETFAPTTVKENETASQLKKEIEQKFDIRIRTLIEVYKEHSLSYSQTEFPDMPLEWDKERLQVLQECLAALPPHFYQNKDGVKLTILLGDQNVPGEYSHLYKLAPYSVEVNIHKDFMASDPLFTPDRIHSEIALAHELTHLQIPVTDHIENNFLTEMSPWYDRITEIIGEPYEVFAPKKLLEVQDKRDSFHPKFYANIGWLEDKKNYPLSETDRIAFEFWKYQEYVLTQKENYNEYIAVLSQNYFQGILMKDPDYFVRFYTMEVGEEKAKQLKQFVEEYIWRNGKKT